MKENEPPETPMSNSKDHQFTTWLQHNGFGKLLSNSTVNSAIVKVLRRYSTEISSKVNQLLEQYNEVQQWKREIGQPALDAIDRYKLMEREFNTERESMNEEYARKKQECSQLQSQCQDLQQQIRNDYAPKLKEYDNMIQQINSIQKEHQSIQQKYKSLKQEHAEQATAIKELTKINKKLNQEISAKHDDKVKAETQIAQLVWLLSVYMSPRDD